MILKDVVFKTFPEIEKIRNDLYEAGAIFSLMTGTGSTVFGIFHNLEEAQKAKSKFSNYFSKIHYE